MGTFIRGTGDSSQRCCGCGSRSNPCDNPPSATLVCRTASASLTKCGFNEWTGYVSTPPKIYRTSTLGGTQTARQTSSGCTICNSLISYVFSGSSTYTRLSCSVTDSRQVVVYEYATNCSTLTNTNTLTASDVGLLGFTDSYTSTVHTSTGPGCVAGTPEYDFIGTATNTLSNEYTTSDLSDDVSTNLPYFSGPFSDAYCTGAYYDISSDELTITKRKMEYKFTLPSLSGYSCYKLTWDEVFTPEGGGSTTVTSKSYLWNGTDTETSVYTINVPANQGTTVVSNITASCSCS